MTEEKKEGISFEEAYARLEQILEKMNSSSVSLDESLKLYEEADALILSCNKRLMTAEQKIEILLKNRTGELALENERPITAAFAPLKNS